MYTYKPRRCAHCTHIFIPTNPSRWCSLICRLLDTCDRSGGDDACWPWKLVPNDKGYGNIVIAGHTRAAHRVMYEQFHNCDLTPDTVIRHSCDNPPCINPSHLLSGTQADNIDDMWNRGRQYDDYASREPVKGSQHGMAKINEELALAIWKAQGMNAHIARQFDVSLSIVESIKRGENWTHVTGATLTKNGPRRGSTSPQCKVSEDDVMEIIAASKRGESGRSIAKRYAISQSMASLIINGKKRKVV